MSVEVAIIIPAQKKTKASIVESKGSRARPFIKWAGGKNWLTSRLGNFLPDKFNNFHEPFLGGGVVYFYLRPTNLSFLSDLNPDLINAFKQVRANTNHVVYHLDSFNNSEQSYYKLRTTISTDKVFNAAKFIFLNKTCYNGIFRVNASGSFNVPYGHDPNANVYDIDNLLAVRRSLRKAQLHTQDFYKALDKIERGDLVFLDPPYTVAHNNNGFIEYNQKIFSWEDQERLADFVARIINRGAYYVLTNAVHNNIADLYKGLGKRYELERCSTITSQIKKRKIISEYLITNCI